MKVFKGCHLRSAADLEGLAEVVAVRGREEGERLMHERVHPAIMPAFIVDIQKRRVSAMVGMST